MTLSFPLRLRVLLNYLIVYWAEYFVYKFLDIEKAWLVGQLILHPVVSVPGGVIAILIAYGIISIFEFQFPLVTIANDAPCRLDE